MRNESIIDKLWEREAESRLDAYERDEISAVSAEEIFEKIERQKVKDE